MFHDIKKAKKCIVLQNLMWIGSLIRSHTIQLHVSSAYETALVLSPKHHEIVYSWTFRKCYFETYGKS